VYKGYVDDPRNTDNAWMETVAVNFHDELGINSILMKYLIISTLFDRTFLIQFFFCPI